jgi:hypothetical protein
LPFEAKSLLENPDGDPFASPERSIELPDETLAFFKLVEPYGRFSLDPPIFVGGMWTLHFEDDYD